MFSFQCILLLRLITLNVKYLPVKILLKINNSYTIIKYGNERSE